MRERCSDLLGDNGWRWRVIRTSNAYAFNDPAGGADRPDSSKSEKPTGTPNQKSFSSMRGLETGVGNLSNFAPSLQQSSARASKGVALA